MLKEAIYRPIIVRAPPLISTALPLSLDDTILPVRLSEATPYKFPGIFIAAADRNAERARTPPSVRLQLHYNRVASIRLCLGASTLRDGFAKTIRRKVWTTLLQET